MKQTLKLKELAIGDWFCSFAEMKSKRGADIYIVKGKPEFNSGHGSSTRMCYNQSRDKMQSKSCRMEIIKMEQ
jgi:hypothetical protein